MKRPRESYIKFENSIRDGAVILDERIQNWIKNVGLDVVQYQHALYGVYNGERTRYYRLRDTPNKKEYNDEIVNWIRDITIYSRSCSKTKKSGIIHDDHDDLGKKDISNKIEDNSIRSRDLSHGGNRTENTTLESFTTALPSNAVGIDAASACIVDALRLNAISRNHSEKRILDMCCAPGGKLLAAINCIGRISKDEKKWHVVGLDVSDRRLKVCKALLKKELVNEDLVEVRLINGDACEFKNKDDTKFDRILLDAECTHEGSLRSVIRTLKYWNEDSLIPRFTTANAATIIETQKKLLHAAIKLLKPMGLTKMKI
ncbi:bifunctional S-adenosyl-L-methionine-dependent methyltransferase superfamily/SAM-dependent methyltransferase RsmB-NOP2-type/RNA (C5-cytosine) methyltransferase/RNA (C5-cytosine) methyltransferase [Babesia duncani]|uniref:Bifunctional S-adenosyl-L-methionine-dependent methyltransferase superfamily/SAM-dependent methyltransferase RsmB-NOP2-type/RNA (C5-cytosine) methyltransferase/RNA (C5-cytosine) methyltransferase n=1 Tax=Babesia duncani TaxID=323732 RepID=A0AAD9PJT7_9APIC|nr:bifunctional S-adenosyl-L-methionine-dependent methyltransferase superfamily/SAM-dependent methyltransferase RsmB-NOP2-type/RNA (C5-cytosine) methyltransferase/RNA (C5-cytosine) methyltransferase [Babesia duncani]